MNLVEEDRKFLYLVNDNDRPRSPNLTNALREKRRILRQRQILCRTEEIDNGVGGKLISQEGRFAGAPRPKEKK